MDWKLLLKIWILISNFNLISAILDQNDPGLIVENVITRPINRDTLRIHIRAKSDNSLILELKLVKTYGFLANKDTPVYSVFGNWHDEDKPIRVWHDATSMQQNGNFTFYHDTDNKAAAVLFTTETGNYLDGIIGEDFVLKNFPMHYLDMADKYDRSHDIHSVIGNSYPAGNIGQLQKLDNKTAENLNSIESFFKESYENACGGELVNVVSWNTFFPQIMLVVDYNATLPNADGDIIRRLLVYWNAVDMLMSLVKSPNIYLNIAGIVIPKTLDALPFLSNDESEDFMEFHDGLEATEEFFYKFRDEFYDDYDLIFAMTTAKLCAPPTKAHPVMSCINGISMGYPDTIHKFNDEFETVDTVALLHYGNELSSYTNAAQKLGFMFAGEYVTKRKLRLCPGIMEEFHRADKTPLTWSNCTLKKFNKYFFTAKAFGMQNFPRYLPRSLKNQPKVTCRESKSAEYSETILTGEKSVPAPFNVSHNVSHDGEEFAEFFPTLALGDRSDIYRTHPSHLQQLNHHNTDIETNEIAERASSESERLTYDEMLNHIGSKVQSSNKGSPKAKVLPQVSESSLEEDDELSEKMEFNLSSPPAEEWSESSEARSADMDDIESITVANIPVPSPTVSPLTFELPKIRDQSLTTKSEMTREKWELPPVSITEENESNNKNTDSLLFKGSSSIFELPTFENASSSSESKVMAEDWDLPPVSVTEESEDNNENSHFYDQFATRYGKLTEQFNWNLTDSLEYDEANVSASTEKWELPPPPEAQVLNLTAEGYEDYPRELTPGKWIVAPLPPYSMEHPDQPGSLVPDSWIITPAPLFVGDPNPWFHPSVDANNWEIQNTNGVHADSQNKSGNVVTQQELQIPLLPENLSENQNNNAIFGEEVDTFQEFESKMSQRFPKSIIKTKILPSVQSSLETESTATSKEGSIVISEPPTWSPPPSISAQVVQPVLDSTKKSSESVVIPEIKQVITTTGSVPTPLEPALITTQSITLPLVAPPIETSPEVPSTASNTHIVISTPTASANSALSSIQVGTSLPASQTPTISIVSQGVQEKSITTPGVSLSNPNNALESESISSSASSPAATHITVLPTDTNTQIVISTVPASPDSLSATTQVGTSLSASQTPIGLPVAQDAQEKPILTKVDTSHTMSQVPVISPDSPKIPERIVTPITENNSSDRENNAESESISEFTVRDKRNSRRGSSAVERRKNRRKFVKQSTSTTFPESTPSDDEDEMESVTESSSPMMGSLAPDSKPNKLIRQYSVDSSTLSSIITTPDYVRRPRQYVERPASEHQRSRSSETGIENSIRQDQIVNEEVTRQRHAELLNSFGSSARESSEYDMRKSVNLNKTTITVKETEYSINQEGLDPNHKIAEPRKSSNEETDEFARPRRHSGKSHHLSEGNQYHQTIDNLNKEINYQHTTDAVTSTVTVPTILQESTTIARLHSDVEETTPCESTSTASSVSEATTPEVIFNPLPPVLTGEEPDESIPPTKAPIVVSTTQKNTADDDDVEFNPIPPVMTGELPESEPSYDEEPCDTTETTSPEPTTEKEPDETTPCDTTETTSTEPTTEKEPEQSEPCDTTETTSTEPTTEKEPEQSEPCDTTETTSTEPTTVKEPEQSEPCDTTETTSTEPTTEKEPEQSEPCDTTETTSTEPTIGKEPDQSEPCDTTETTSTEPTTEKEPDETTPCDTTPEATPEPYKYTTQTPTETIVIVDKVTTPESIRDKREDATTETIYKPTTDLTVPEETTPCDESSNPSPGSSTETNPEKTTVLPVTEPTIIVTPIPIGTSEPVIDTHPNTTEKSSDSESSDNYPCSREENEHPQVEIDVNLGVKIITNEDQIEVVKDILHETHEINNDEDGGENGTAIRQVRNKEEIKTVISALEKLLDVD